MGSDLQRVDAHRIEASEYDDLPELTDEMLARARVNKGGRPRAQDPRTLVSIRLPESVLAKWRASGPGWQTRMADLLAKAV
ncbi:BrnA antitoxin family protein [Vandammella animalimorsus]|uniref:BrnA antitoxin family protein n=1 Tax=Vandammella animalimorsus TaxID=2029117 RepID=UPI001EEF4795|nr:BrnA antitoxin family protein [Vandammella animalimorsus]